MVTQLSSNSHVVKTKSCEGKDMHAAPESMVSNMRYNTRCADTGYGYVYRCYGLHMLYTYVYRCHDLLMITYL